VFVTSTTRLRATTRAGQPARASRSAAAATYASGTERSARDAQLSSTAGSSGTSSSDTNTGGGSSASPPPCRRRGLLLASPAALLAAAAVAGAPPLPARAAGAAACTAFSSLAAARNPGLSFALGNRSKQLYYPQWLAGTWRAAGTFRGAAFPLGPRFVSRALPGALKASLAVALPDVGAGMDGPVSALQRFEFDERQGGVVADRWAPGGGRLLERARGAAARATEPL
jgi:hypothetical protein